MVLKQFAAIVAQRSLIVVAFTLTDLVPLAAASQTMPAPLMRPGQPEVLMPPEPRRPSPAFDLQRFKAAYAAAGSPKVVLFWNRELTDRLVADRVELSRDSVWEQETRSRQLTERQSERIQEKRNTSESAGAREGPTEERGARMRSAYVGTLLGSGVQLLDRNLLVRNQGFRDKAASDPQQVEAAALQAGAVWLLEVVLAPITNTPDTWLLHSRIKRISDGALIVDSLYDDAKNAVAKTATRSVRRFEADSVNGGYKEASFGTTLESADLLLATRAAEALLQALSNNEGLAHRQ